MQVKHCFTGVDWKQEHKCNDDKNRPAENTEHEVEYKERADDDKADEVDPRPAVSLRVVNLRA